MIASIVREIRNMLQVFNEGFRFVKMLMRDRNMVALFDLTSC